MTLASLFPLIALLLSTAGVLAQQQSPWPMLYRDSSLSSAAVPNSPIFSAYKQETFSFSLDLNPAFLPTATDLIANIGNARADFNSTYFHCNLTSTNETCGVTTLDPNLLPPFALFNFDSMGAFRFYAAGGDPNNDDAQIVRAFSFASSPPALLWSAHFLANYPNLAYNSFADAIDCVYNTPHATVVHRIAGDSGATVWTSNLPIVGGLYAPYPIVSFPSGDLVIACECATEANKVDQLLMLVSSSSGALLWNASFDNTATYKPIQVMAQDDYLVLIWSTGAATGMYGIEPSSGNLIWNTTLNADCIAGELIIALVGEQFAIGCDLGVTVYSKANGMSVSNWTWASHGKALFRLIAMVSVQDRLVIALNNEAAAESQSIYMWQVSEPASSVMTVAKRALGVERLMVNTDGSIVYGGFGNTSVLRGYLH